MRSGGQGAAWGRGGGTGSMFTRCSRSRTSIRASVVSGQELSRRVHLHVLHSPTAGMASQCPWDSQGGRAGGTLHGTLAPHTASFRRNVGCLCATRSICEWQECEHVFCSPVARTVKSAGQQPYNGSFVPVLAPCMVLHSWPCPLRPWQTYLVGECVVAACCHLTTLTVHRAKRGLQLFHDSPSLQLSGAVRRSSVAGGLRMAHHVQFKGAKKVGSPGTFTRGGCCCGIHLSRAQHDPGELGLVPCLTCLARMLRTSD